jgi:hypothetical protein
LSTGATFSGRPSAAGPRYVFQVAVTNTCPPKGVHIHLNGVEQEVGAQIGTLYCNPCFAVQPAHGTAPLRLGTRDLASFLVGALDEVAIYPRVLTADEILSNYQLGIS